MIRDAEVVWNPFEDLVPRVDKEAVKAEHEAKAWVGGEGVADGGWEGGWVRRA